jgi:hypothetical protein
MQNLIIGDADFKQRRLLLYKILIFFPEINLIENQKRKPSSHCSGTYCYLWSHSTVGYDYGHPFDLLLEFVGVHTERQVPYLGDPKLKTSLLFQPRKF